MSAPERIDKIVHIGLQRPAWTLRGFHTHCRVTYDGRKLTISGVQGPLPPGNARGSCGQIVDNLQHFQEFASGWSPSLLHRFRGVWSRWHLNDFRAGSPRQEGYLRLHPVECKGLMTYHTIREALARVGLDPDPEYIYDGEPYRYGSAWLLEEVPPTVLKFLDALPAAGRVPAWI